MSAWAYGPCAPLCSSQSWPTHDTGSGLGSIRIIWGNIGLYRDDGKENGNYYLGFRFTQP